MNKRKNISNKILALVLSIVLCVGMLPMGLISSVFAESVDSVTVSLKDYAKSYGTVTLTQTDDESVTKEVAIINGTAIFKGFVDTEKSYNLSAKDLIGFENYTQGDVIFEGNSFETADLTAIEKITVNGKVLAGESKVTVSYSAYNGEVKGSAEANEDGSYSFEFYKGIEYSVSFNASDEKYNDITDKKVTVSSSDNADFGTEELSVKQFAISTNAGDNGSIFPENPNVDYGENAPEITVKANEHYVINELLVDGKSVDEAKGQTNYSFDNIKDVQTTHSVSATFVQDEFEVTFLISNKGRVTITDGTSVSTVGEVVIDNDGSKDEALEDNKYLKVGQKITASVLEDQYHIKSFKVGDTEQLEETPSNDTHSQSYTFDNTATNITVVFALDTYSVSVESGEKGTASLDKSTVEYGDDAKVTINPGNGYNIDTIKVNGNKTDSFATEDGFEYILELKDIQKDTKVEVSFAEIPSENMDNVSFNSDDALKRIEDTNTYIYKNGATVKFSTTGNRLNINGNKSDYEISGNASYEISDSTVIKSISVFYGNKWHNVQLDKDINIIIDKDAPVLGEIKQGAWTNGDYTVNGIATDASETAPSSGLHYVVWSSEELNKAEDVLSSSNKADIKDDGTYAFIVSGEQEQKYFVYAVDWSENVSEAKSTIVKIDKTAPQIDSFKFVDVKATSFGTFANKDVTVRIYASDTGNIQSSVSKITYNNTDVEAKDFKTDESKKLYAEFTLQEADFKTANTVSATVTDNAGNESEPTVADKKNSNIISDDNTILITKAEPTVEISLPDGEKSLVRYDEKDEKGETSKVWFNGDFEYTINISDTTTGIQNIEITLNNNVITEVDGITIVNNKDGNPVDFSSTKIPEQTLVVDTSKYDLNDGENVLTVKVTNVAQNSAEQSSTAYKDTTNPEITGFNFNVKGDSVPEKIINFLSFGIFCNEAIEVTVTAQDVVPKDVKVSSGIKEIVLYGDNVKLETQTYDTKNNNAVFTLPLDNIVDAEKVVFNKTISAIAIDNCDNESVKCSPNSENSNASSANLMIETVPSNITIDIPNTMDGMNEKTLPKNQDWFENDIDFSISTDDADSGIKSIKVNINESIISPTEINIDDGNYKIDNKDINNVDFDNLNENSDENSKVNKVSFAVNTSQIDVPTDGKYTLNIEVTDNAGNVKDMQKTVYIDRKAPVISKFKFNHKDYNESDGKVVNVDNTDYGFYFKEDTIVTISASDVSPSSGVRDITYYTEDYTEDINGKTTAETSKTVDANGEISFDIPANFKGQIYAYATDNVGNSDKTFQHPNGTVIEDKDQHKKTSDILFALPETKVKDDKNNNLYSKDTDIDVLVSDTFSGIRTIEWSVEALYDKNKNQTGTINVENNGTVVAKGSTALQLAKKEITKDKNLVTSIPLTLTVSNDSNDILVTFILTDRAGNTTTKTQKLSIDKTAPRVVVKMNENDDSSYTGLFKTNRTADIYVYERNFNNSDFVFNATKTDDNGNKSQVALKSNFAKVGTQNVEINGTYVECYVYKTSKTFSADSDYTFAVSSKDMVGNSAGDKSVKYSSDTSLDYSNQNDADRVIDKNFTVDKTNPVVSVSYDNNSAQNTKYFKAARTATITVKEHNFTADKNRIVYTRTSSLDGKTIANPSISSWSKNGNTYTAKIVYSSDGDFKFGISVQDKAGNIVKDEKVNYVNGREVSKSFTVDTKIKAPTISGVKNGNSYKNKVIPQILVDDVNFATSTVKLTRTVKDQKNVDVTKKFIKNQPVNRKTVSEDTFTKIRENDGIYTLSVNYSDKAGNKSSKSVIFTVNRFGSVYTYSSDLIALNDSHVKNVKGNISIAEYNPDRLKEGSLNLRITCDSAPLNPISYTVTPEVNNKAPIGSSGWYQYDYVINNSNFKNDGLYTISVASQDSVGNKSDKSDIKFYVDATSPEITQITGLEKSSYNENTHNFTLNVSDSIGLKSVVVKVDGKIVENIEKFDNVTVCKKQITLPEGANQEIQIVVTDLAGNVTDTSSKNFKPSFEFNSDVTVSTNIFVLWYSNKLLFWGSIGGVVILAAGISFLVVSKKRRKETTVED